MQEPVVVTGQTLGGESVAAKLHGSFGLSLVWTEAC